MLTPPGSYTAFPGTDDEFTTTDGGESGILGGDSRPEVNVDDFIWTFNLVDGRLVGTVSGLNDGSGDFHPGNVDFPATLDCVSGFCLIGPDDNATITETGQTPTTYVGFAVFEKGFYAYNLVSTEEDSEHGPDRLLAFGGTSYTLAPGKLYSFALTPDVTQSTFAPFASAESTPHLFSDTDTGAIGASLSPLLLLTKDTENPTSRDVWLQTSFAITGEGTEQQSFINVALGGLSEDGGLIGARRGGSSVDITEEICDDGCRTVTNREALAFTGDIASLAGPDGSHVLGSDNPNIVIGFDSTGTHNI